MGFFCDKSFCQDQKHGCQVSMNFHLILSCFSSLQETLVHTAEQVSCLDSYLKGKEVFCFCFSEKVAHNLCPYGISPACSPDPMYLEANLTLIRVFRIWRGRRAILTTNLNKPEGEKSRLE